jgi:hypothetical protein
MSLEKRIQALESRKVTSIRRDGTGNCICFPEGWCAALISKEDFEAAGAVICPEHGDRLVGVHAGGLYSPPWYRKINWENGWPNADSQTRRALFATYRGWPERPERYTEASQKVGLGGTTHE